MRRSDRELLAATAEQVRELGKSIDELRATQETTSERLKAVERELEVHRKGLKGRLRGGFAEVEDLLALYHDIGPESSLPRMRDWAAGAELLRYLFEEVVGRKRTRILECGSGSSTVILAYAVRALGSGHVTALDHSEHYAEQTRRELAHRDLSEWAEVVHAPLTDVEINGKVWSWYDTAAISEGGIDLLVVDGPPAATGREARYPALPLVADRLSEHALIVLDDARRPDERAVVARWIEQFPQFESQMLKHDKGTVVVRRSEQA